MTTVQISIVIYIGHPVDAPQYRHAVLWFRFADHSPSLMAHLVGNPGEFKFQCRPSFDPRRSNEFAKEVDMGDLEVAAKPSEIVELLRRVQIVQNSKSEFNCQTWVEYALRKLQEANYLMEAVCNQGLEGLVAAVAEAKVQ